MELIDNSQANWQGKDFYYDDNGVAHRQDLHYGDDYTLESGSLIDDVQALSNGYIFEDEYDENN